MRKIVTVSLLCFLPVLIGAQVEPCLKALEEIETAMLQRRLQTATTWVLQYNLETEDWEGAKNKQAILWYQKGSNIHFFSDQADLIQDQKDLFIALHQERVLIQQEAGADLSKTGVSTDFLSWRRQYLNQCRIEQCTAVAGKKNIKEMSLVPINAPEGVDIEKMNFVLALDKMSILETEVAFRSTYALKRLRIKFQHAFDEVVHDFGSTAKIYVLNPNGKPKGKYTGYRLINNR